jgi:hypothetical protein
MKSIKPISAAIALLALSMAIGVTSVRAAPETPGLGTGALTPLLSAIYNNANAIGNDAFSTVDPSTLSPPPTQHDGPYTTTNDPDSGSCGNDWATDSFTRFFSIFSMDGALVVVEQFKDGTFVTPAPSGDPFATDMSPGACNNGTVYDGGVVNNGVTGGFHGYETIPIPSGFIETNNSPYCDAAGMTNTGCTTATFIDTHFSCTFGLTCFVTVFFFHYSGGLGQGLIANSWIDEQLSSQTTVTEIGDIESAAI